MFVTMKSTSPSLKATKKVQDSPKKREQDSLPSCKMDGSIPLGRNILPKFSTVTGIREVEPERLTKDGD